MNSLISQALLLALLFQSLLVAAFSLTVRSRRKEFLKWNDWPIGGWPVAEVVLCLRGADIKLLETLQSLARQNYLGEWRLQVVVDSAGDPSREIIEEFINMNSKSVAEKPTWQNLKIQTLDGRPLRGSLKCASLLQAFEQLNNQSAVVVLIDADAVVQPDWLTNLVKACLQPGIGAVSGNRWFSPEQGTTMGWTRSVWNAGALVLMTLLSIPWGGSLAIRREVIEAGPWKKLLSHGLCEDTGLLGPLRELGLAYAFRPESLVIDRHDGIALSSLLSWISRQLLTARLHHPAWPLVVFHGLGTTALLIIGLIQGAWLSLIIYELGCVVLLAWIEMVALQQPPRSLWGWARTLLIGQFVDGCATAYALFARNVEWSKVIYQITLQPRGVVIKSLSESVGE